MSAPRLPANLSLSLLGVSIASTRLATLVDDDEIAAELLHDLAQLHRCARRTLKPHVRDLARGELSALARSVAEGALRMRTASAGDEGMSDQWLALAVNANELAHHVEDEDQARNSDEEEAA